MTQWFEILWGSDLTDEESIGVWYFSNLEIAKSDFQTVVLNCAMGFSRQKALEH